LEILDVVLPIIGFVLCAVFTDLVVRAARERRSKVIMLVWFVFVFGLASATVANMSLKYYAQAATQPFVTLNLVENYLTMFSSTFMIDAISVYMAIVFTVVGAIVFLYSIFYVDPEEAFSGRYMSVMLIVIGCIIGATFSGDFMTLFIFWEASTAGSCFMMLYRKNPRSLYSTLKFLIMIIMASAFIIYGLSIVYGITGTLNFWAVREALTSLQDKHIVIIAFAFIATGYAIEAAIVPFHTWLPDAYTSAPASSSAFLSALIDQGSYYVLLRILIYILTPPTVLEWTSMLAVFSALSMVVGNLLALNQSNVKRLIAYVCIADVGYNLVAITSVTPLGIMGNLYFFLIGGVTTALSFMAVGNLNKMGLETLDDFSAVGRKAPMTSLALLIGLFSFAGIPPLGGFIAKYLVFTAAIEANMGWLAVIGVLTSVIQTAYLLRLINRMYGRPLKEGEHRINESKGLLVPVFILVGAVVVLGIFPSLVLNLIGPVIQEFPFIPG
jgi:proton-translocating NADH-quinone oxidoreductase chain N